MFEVEVLTPEKAKKLSPHERKVKIKALEAEFSSAFEVCTMIANELKLVKESCPHVKSVAVSHARFCNDCGEYYKVDTSFSAETEAWFKTEHEKALRELGLA